MKTTMTEVMREFEGLPFIMVETGTQQELATGVCGAGWESEELCGAWLGTYEELGYECEEEVVIIYVE